MSMVFAAIFASTLIPAAPLDERLRFEALAERLQFFDVNDFTYYEGRAGHLRLPPAWADNWRETHALLSSDIVRTSLLHLLEHKNPKVRTLALAALARKNDPKLLPDLAALMADREKTFPRIQPVHHIALQFNREIPPPPLEEQTVGAVAKEIVGLWLLAANYQPKDFAAYWATRKDRKFCASWFNYRFGRIIGASTSQGQPPNKTEVDQLRALAKELASLPQTDRDWTLLWLVSKYDTSVYDEVLRYLASPEETTQAGKRLGPDKLLALIQGQEISSDPDLGTDQHSRASRQILILYVLRRATQFLRPSDADAVLALEKTYPTPFCAIAAADLQPEKARKVLHDALARYAGASLSWQRAALAADLWRLAGEAEIGFLVDWFYTEKVDLNPSTTQTQLFLEGIAGVRAPADRKLLARLIADPRLDKLDYQSLRSLVETVNRWVKEPLLPHSELHSTRYWRGDNLEGLVEWRRKLKESVPAWNK